MKNSIAVISILSFLVACTSLKEIKRPLRVESIPSDCEVFSSTGKLLGKTPLDIPSESIAAFRDNSHLSLLLRKPEYVDTNLVIELKSVGSYKVKLNRMDDAHYAQWVMGAYSSKTNRMVREIMEIQGLLFARKNDQAKVRIEKFISQNGAIAAPHTIRASLALSEGKIEEAKVYVKKALNLDSNDMTARQLMNRLEVMDGQ